MLRKLLFCAVLGTGGIASANGFYINEHDAKVTGRGGATTATNTDPSSIVFNPGGIPVGEGTNVSIGGSLIAAKGSYFDTMDNRTDTDSSPAVVPNIYITSRVHEMVAVGIGFHLPFGLAVSWPNGHAQADVIQDQTLRTYFITPSVGLNLNKYVPGLTVGGGIDLVPSTVELKQALIFGDTTGTATLGGDGFGIGGRFGVQYQPAALKALRLGAMWRSPVKVDFEGKGDFDIAAPFREQLPPDGDISTSITMPQSVSGGVAYNATPELQLELNAVWINWKSFKELRIHLPAGAETVSPQLYEDTVTVRVGAEYALPKQNAAVRVGYIYDPTPIPNTTVSARLPDANRHDITAGGSYMFGNYAVHLGLLYVLPSSQKTSDEQYMPVFKGKYEVTAFVASLSLAGRFGK